MFKRILICLAAVVVAASAHADTQTPRAGATIITIGSTGWGAKVNANTAIFDSSVALQGVTNVFTAANTYTAPVSLSNTNLTLTGAAGYVLSGSSITGAYLLGDGNGITNLNATQLLTGTIPAARIGTGAIDTTKLASDSVTTVKILDQNVTTAKLADLNVTTGKLAASAVDTTKLASDAVTTVKILDQNVTTAKLADLNVTNAKLATSSVDTAKLASDAVTTVKILDQAVTTAKLADLSVTTAKIADLNVTTAKIAALAVDTSKLASDSVTTVKILDANVTTAKIANAAVDTTKLASDSVTTVKILDANVTNAKIANAAVDTSKLAANGLSAGTFGSATQVAQIITTTDGRLTFAGNVTISGVPAATVPAAGVQAGSLGASVIASSIAINAVGNGQIANGSVDTNKLASDAVTTVKILDANVTNAKVANSAIDTNKLASDAVTTVKILDQAVTTNKHADLSVTTAKIAAAAVDTTKLASDAVTTVKILDANVTAAKIASGAAASNIGAVGNDLSGTLPNPTVVRSSNAGGFTVTGQETVVSSATIGGNLKAAGSVILGSATGSCASGKVCALGTGGPALEWGDTSEVGRLTYSGTNPIIASLAGDIILTPNSTNNITTLSGGGRLGVGTATPGTTLDVNGAATIRGQETVTGTATVQGAGLKVNTSIANNALFSDILVVGGGANLTGSNATLRLENQGVAADQRTWDMATSGQDLIYRGINSAGTLTSEYMKASKDAGAHTISSVTFTTAGTARMSIVESGRVGIGTASPLTRFHVKGADAIGAILEGAGGGGTDSVQLRLHGQTSGLVWVIGSEVNGTAGTHPFEITDGVSGLTRVTVLPAGNVGVGTASPAAKLDIQGPSGGTNMFLRNTTGGTSNYISVLDVSGNQWNIGNVSSSQMAIFQNGTTPGASGVVFSGERTGFGTASPTSMVMISTGVNGESRGLEIASPLSNGTGNKSDLIWSASGNDVAAIQMQQPGSPAFDLAFLTYNSGLAQHMVIKADGKVGIINSSTTAPTTALTVYGIITSSTPIPTVACNGGATAKLSAASTNSNGEFTITGAAASQCTVTFNTTAGYAFTRKPSCVCNNQSQVLLVTASMNSSLVNCNVAVTFGTGDVINYICESAP